MRPLIGITASLLQEFPKRDWIYTPTDYFRAVEDAGGIPVLLPLPDSDQAVSALLERIDGLLLSGGADMDPMHFGEDPHQALGPVSPERDTAELGLIREALRRDMPILGICRGHQVLAVACGGTLIQDLPAQLPGALKHQQEAPRWHASHSVTAKPGTRLAGLLGTEFRVNSFHHQAVRAVPADWAVSAVAPDGVIEAMEHPGYRFALSVQWHPESFTGRSGNFRRLFQAFLEACRP